MVGLRTGSTTSAAILFQAGTNGQDSSEVAADTDVKAGVVTFYRKCQSDTGNIRYVTRG